MRSHQGRESFTLLIDIVTEVRIGITWSVKSLSCKKKTTKKPTKQTTKKTNKQRLEFNLQNPHLKKKSRHGRHL